MADAAPSPAPSKSEAKRRKKQDKREATMQREILARLKGTHEVCFAGGATAGGRHVFAMPSHRIYADTLPSLKPWLQSLVAPLGGGVPLLLAGWPFAVVSFADASAAAAAAAAATRLDCAVDGDKPTGGDGDRRMLLVVQGSATIKISALRALAAGGDGDALRSAVPRYSLTEPVEEEAIKIGIVGGTGTISTAIVAQLLALQARGGSSYDIVCINRGSNPAPYPSGVRHLQLDRHERENFERAW